MQNIISQKSRNQAALLAYTVRGWSVFPFSNIKAQESEQSGNDSKASKDATNNYQKALALFDAKPEAAVALAVGKVSNLCVLVVDPSNGGDDILQSLEWGIEPLPETVRLISSDGKEYIFFNHPAGITLKKYKRGKNAGLYLLTDGDFVLLESGRNAENCSTVFDVFHHPDKVKVCDAPAWLFEGTGIALPRFLLRSSVPGFPCNQTSKYGDLLLEIAANEFMDESTQDLDSALKHMSFQVAVMFKREHVGYDEAFRTLFDLWSSIADMDPEPLNRAQILSIIRDCFRSVHPDTRLSFHNPVSKVVYLV